MLSGTQLENEAVQGSCTYTSNVKLLKLKIKIKKKKIPQKQENNMLNTGNANSIATEFLRSHGGQKTENYIKVL
jgi:hypothetical protein